MNKIEKLSNTRKFWVSVGIFLVAIATVAVYYLFITDTKIGATAFPKTICHNTPSNQVTLTFQNQQSYNGHLGTPHSGSTYDTNGACVTPTPTNAPSVTPIFTLAPTAQPSATLTPSITEVPSVAPEPTVTNIPVVKQDVSDNRSDGKSDGKCSLPPCVDNRSGVPLYKETINK